MIRGAIFDLDGTLLDSMPIWNHAAEKFLDRLGVEAEPGLGQILYPMSMAEGSLYLRDRYHLAMSVDEIIDGVNRVIEDFYAYQAQLKEGAEQFLEGMKQAGIRMAIATSNDRRIFESALRRLGIMELFDRIFTATEIGVGKVKPDIYLAVAGHMGTLPKDTWVFEDALYAIRTAKEAGFRTVGVYDPSSADDWEEIKRITDIHMEKLDNIHAFLGGANA